MPFPPPPVTSIVLPEGATSGQRIVLDASTDTITGYNPDNTIAWQLAGGTSIHAGTADSATNATDATNLTGGGSASGTTTIAGELVVGNPAAAHAVIGTDGAGADGVRLYASDGVTVLIDLNIASTPTITGAHIRTAATGSRIELDSANADHLSFYDAVAGFAGALYTFAGHTGLEASSANTLVGFNLDDTQFNIFCSDSLGRGGSIGISTGPGGYTVIDPGLRLLIGGNGDVASDTAAQAVTAAAGYTSNLSVRRLGTLVQMIGSISINAGAIATGASVTVAAAGGIPAAYRPTRVVNVPIAHTWGGGTAPPLARAQIGTDGSIVVMDVQQTSVTSVWFDHVSYWM